MNTDKIKDRILGYLYGQAIGDVRGFASETITMEDVKSYYPHGISKYSRLTPIIALFILLLEGISK